MNMINSKINILDLPIDKQLELVIKQSKSSDQLKNDIIGCLVINGLKTTYNVGKNLFNTYVEQPRKDIKQLIIQNQIMINNQNEFIRLMKNNNQRVR